MKNYKKEGYPDIHNGIRGVRKLAKQLGFNSFSYDKERGVYTFPISDENGYAFINNKTDYYFIQSK